MSEQKIIIEFCMGSSCFSRGNNKSLAMVKHYIADKKLEERVDLKGHVCWELCAKGPSVRINGKLYQAVTPNCIIDLLEHHIEQG